MNIWQDMDRIVQQVNNEFYGKEQDFTQEVDVSDSCENDIDLIIAKFENDNLTVDRYGDLLIISKDY